MSYDTNILTPNPSKVYHFADFAAKPSDKRTEKWSVRLQFRFLDENRPKPTETDRIFDMKPKTGRDIFHFRFTTLTTALTLPCP